MPAMTAISLVRIGALAVGLTPAALAAQEAPPHRHVAVATEAPRAADVATADAMVQAYYAVITGPAPQPRQWSRDRSLYIPELRFVATGVTRRGPYSPVMRHPDVLART